MIASGKSLPGINTRSMTRLYIFALTLVALLTLAGQAVVQFSLSSLQGDTTTVNLAGRQRMLSQRIPRLALELLDETVPEKRRRLIGELRELLKTWQENHVNLVRGSAQVGLTGSNSPAVTGLFSQIQPDVERLTNLIDRLLQHDWDSSDEVPELDRLAMNQSSDAFLISMDMIVWHYAAEARQRVNRLRWLERGLFIATLVVLVCEGCFIFGPAVASLRRAFDSLQVITGELKTAKEAAEDANHAKTQFLARVSHELRTPLHAISGMLTLVRREPLSSAQRQRVTVAHKSTRILRRLVDDLLDVASDAAGNAWQLHLSPVDVKRLIHDCCRLMQPLAERKQLSLNATVDVTTDRFMLDEFRLQQMLINLLQNAIRYTNEGSVACFCRVESREEQTWLCIEVRDTGCGIAAEHHERIFESFVRLEGMSHSSTCGPRMGLGLPITASLVRSMHGHISVKSQPGHGSSFTIELPVARAARDAPVKTIAGRKLARERRTVSNAVSNLQRAKPSLTALVVDDEVTNRRLMREYLRFWNVHSYLASNHHRAAQILQRHRPDLILLDLHVGDEDPLMFLRSVRGKDGSWQPRIYIVTADVTFSVERLPADARVDGILLKPLDLNVLQAELQRAGLLLSSIDSEHRNEETQSPLDDLEFATLKRQLRESLGQRLPQEICAIHGAMRKSDRGLVQLIAHRVRGSAANAGWTELATKAACLEEAQTDPEAHLAAADLAAFINNS